MFKQLDHIAILVRNTEEALPFYRDTLGLPLVLSEVIEEAGVRLTHLDMGNTHLQLVEPLTQDHPLRADLDARGEGLHHLCFLVDDVSKAMGQLPDRNLKANQTQPHRGPRGRQAAFIDPTSTRNVRWEITSDPNSSE